MTKRPPVQWHNLFQAQLESGKSAAAFCREHKLCPKYFSLRKKQLGWSVAGSTKGLSDKTAFVPVVLHTPQSKTSFSSTPAFHLTYRNTVLELPGTVSVEWLSGLMRALA